MNGELLPITKQSGLWIVGLYYHGTAAAAAAAAAATADSVARLLWSEIAETS